MIVISITVLFIQLLLQWCKFCDCSYNQEHSLVSVTDLCPNALPLDPTLPLQVLLQSPQAPFRPHPITVSICIGYKAWLVLVDAVIGHMHTPPPAGTGVTICLLVWRAVTCTT